MPEIKLKNCPFCGKKPSEFTSGFGTEHYVKCNNPNCTVKTVTYAKPSKEKAAEAWNKRACDTKKLHAYWIPSEYGCKCSMCKKEFLAEDAAKLYECPNCKSQMGEPRKEADDA